MNYTSWYQAAAYCDWLSEREEIPENQRCYEMKSGKVTKLKANYLSLTGYRLPTEAEWEYACRAGAVTSRYYGESGELLKQYAWFLENAKHRSWPVGSKKPNDLGLFDMLGNVWTWSQESYKDDPEAEGIEAIEGNLDIEDNARRVVRDGSFDSQAVGVRSAHRYRYVPAFRHYDIGIRPARTVR